MRSSDVNNKVIVAEEQLMVRTSQVSGWMQRVDAKGREVEEILLEGTQYLERRCLNGCCPKNCWSSYKLGKKVVKELLDVEEMKLNGVFETVAENPPCVPVQELPENFTVGLDLVFEKALNLLQIDGVGVLGLYGAGGVGKTTLLKKINNELSKRNNSFDIVIWVDISSNVNMGTIQEVIRERLRLMSRQGSVILSSQTASDIFNALQRKKFLILLDDVWEQIDLPSIGIPRPSAQNKSKIVLTTRSLDVCGSMGAHHNIEVNCLNNDQSWNLFKEKVGPETLATDPQIPNLAKKVAEKCHGLPLALITVGASMASKKNSREWQCAISDLNKCAAKFPCMEKHVLPLLKFSYDRLPSRTDQVCFLFCALYPEDYQIPVDSLIEQWIGLGYINGFEDYEEALNRGHSIIGTLTRTCLLENVVVDENVGVDEKVKMHDVIRELALWIDRECGREEGKVFVKSGHIFTEIPMHDLHPTVVQTISLIDTRIDQLEILHNCPNLSTFFAPLNYNLSHIYDDFFLFMPVLKFLDLSGSYIMKIPTSICELVELEFLDLTHTNIKRLPPEMGNLTKLKYLSVSGRNDHGISTEIPPGMIKNFLNLEILKLEDRKAVDIDELGCLNKLKALDINLSDSKDIEKFVSNPRLCNSARRLIIEKCNEVTFLTPSAAAAPPPSSLSWNLCFGCLRQLRRLVIRHSSEIEELIFTNESEIG